MEQYYNTTESSKSDDGLELLHSMRAEAKSRGFLSDEEIDAEIQAARADSKNCPKGKADRTRGELDGR